MSLLSLPLTPKATAKKKKRLTPHPTSVYLSVILTIQLDMLQKAGFFYLPFPFGKHFNGGCKKKHH